MIPPRTSKDLIMDTNTLPPAQPADAPVAAPAAPTPPPSPFDTSALTAERDALMAELEQARESLERDVAEAVVQQITPEMIDVFAADPVEFIMQIFAIQNQILESNYNSKIRRVGEIDGEVAALNEEAGIDALAQEFLAQHPELDMATLLDFFQNDISPRDVARIEQLPPEQIFPAIYELWLVKNPQAAQPATPATPTPPPNLAADAIETPARALGSGGRGGVFPS